MTMLKEVVAELISMFVAERRLTIAILGVVTVAGCVANFTDLDPLVAGTMMLLGCLIPVSYTHLTLPTKRIV